MSRSVRLSLLSLSLFLVLLPLVLEKPGLPGGLKADEAAYYLMAESLAHDHDLRLTPADVTRAFQEFPFGEIDNLIVMTDDGWRTVYYGKPYLYSLLAAPLAALAGADGLLCFNMLLTLAMVWMGAIYLARFNDGGVAALFSAGFFLASTGFAYAFWLQPEVFSMAAVCAACFLVFHRSDRAGPDGAGDGGGGPAASFRSRRRLGALIQPALAPLSGAALAFAAYNKPVFAALGLPLVFALVHRRRWRAAAGWLLGFAVALGAVAGLAVALTGHPTPYLGVQRMGVTLCEPGVMPVQPAPDQATSGITAERPTGGAWSWIFHLPDVQVRQLAENFGYFLWGRHTGLLLYFPFAALAVVLFLVHGRRDRARWLLLASLAVVALFFLLFIPYNWQGGGGFVGNRYYVNVIPAFLFLVTRVRPRAVVAARLRPRRPLPRPAAVQPLRPQRPRAHPAVARPRLAVSVLPRRAEPARAAGLREADGGRPVVHGSQGRLPADGGGLLGARRRRHRDLDHRHRAADSVGLPGGERGARQPGLARPGRGPPRPRLRRSPGWSGSSSTLAIRTGFGARREPPSTSIASSSTPRPAGTGRGRAAFRPRTAPTSPPTTRGRSRSSSAPSSPT